MKAKYIIFVSSVIILSIAGVIITGLPLFQPSTDEQPSQSDSQGSVTVTVSYLGSYRFKVTLDTHSGSLDYDLTSSAFVRDKSTSVTNPVAWDGGTGGHHLTGNLTFQQFDDLGNFSLIMTNIGGIEERIFNW
ncbi:MAG TPA: hypothetical protein VJ044_02770 [Candidatus Hodarchaeales archaeon]|nr:hypothetical protein [Candidatus Hodarchaeales archaeon]